MNGSEATFARPGWAGPPASNGPATATSKCMSTEELISVQEQTLSRLLDWIKAVDVKVPIVMVVNTAMLGYVGSSVPSPAEWTWFAVIGAAMGTIPPGLSLWFCFMATSPKLDGPRKSLLYFGGISDRGVDEYNLELAATTREQYLRDLNLQCHRNSVIATKKYWNLGRAMKVLVWGVLPWMVSLYVLKAGQVPASMH